MSVTVEEKFGRILSNRRAERHYVVRGTNDDDEARSEVVAVAPISFATGGNTLVRSETEVEELSNDLWLAIVTYVRSEAAPPEPDVSSFSFETRGGTQRITQSLATVGSFAEPGATPPNFEGAIGVGQDNQVEGVDVTVPVFNCQVTKTRATVDATYIGNLYLLTGRVNDAPFTILTDDGAEITFAAGECLYLGAAGGKRGDDPWEISHAFAGSPNVTGLSVGAITGIAKKGWEYLWVRYQAYEDTSAKVLATKPIAVYVEKVAEEGNFALLGL